MKKNQITRIKNSLIKAKSVVLLSDSDSSEDLYLEITQLIDELENESLIRKIHNRLKQVYHYLGGTNDQKNS